MDIKRGRLVAYNRGYNTYMKKQIIIIGVLVIVIAGIAAIVHFKGTTKGITSNTSGKQPSVIVNATADPVETTMNFEVAWLALRQSTSTNPYQAGLPYEAMLSKDLGTRLAAAEGTSSKLDPVLCQTSVPERVGAKVIFTKSDTAQVMVISRKPQLPNQAIVSLKKDGKNWQITDITCNAGESAASTGKYDFTESGSLLKSDKMPKPLDPKYWYLVYTQDGQKGYTAALLFDKDSQCVATDGTKSTCAPDQTWQAQQATVEGDMTETGVQVKQLTFTK